MGCNRLHRHENIAPAAEEERLIVDESQNACGGRCCSDFVISHTPLEIGARYRDAIAHIIAGEDRPYDWQDVQVAEMIIRIDEDDERGPRYTCKNLLSSGLCGVYDRRPDMCREFPGYGRGGDCYHCGFRQPLPPCRRLRSGDVPLA